jgi:hypothetical protein
MMHGPKNIKLKWVEKTIGWNFTGTRKYEQAYIYTTTFQTYSFGLSEVRRSKLFL